MVRCFAALVAFSACNQIFDLEAPEEIEMVEDADGDGIVDSRDNCPQLANPDQVDNDRDRRGDACDDCPTSPPTRDRDADGIDDACDPCVLGPNVDDDGDGVMDSCDLCPVTFGVEQLDADGDIVGNACDEGLFQSLDNERVLFDPLTEIGSHWQGGADWELGPDGSSVLPRTTRPASLTWMDPDVFPAAVSVAFTLVASVDTIVTVDISSTLETRCEIRCTQGQCMLFTTSEIGPTTPGRAIPAHGTLQVLMRQAGMMKFGFIECLFYSDGLDPTVDSNMTNLIRGSQTRITATPGAQVHGVDVIR